MPATAAPTPASLVADELLSYLQIRKGLEGVGYLRAPEAVPDGWETYTYRLQLHGRRGLSAALRGPLALRVYAGPEGLPRLQRDWDLQNRLASRGYPVARPVLAEEEADFLGGPFLLMEWVEGQTLLDRLQRRWITLFWAPARMAAVHARLHRTTLAELGLRPPDRPFLDRQLEALRTAVETYDLGGLEAGVAWLRAHRPVDRERPCLLHLDFHPKNIIYRRGRCTVLDWSESDFGDRHADVAAALTMIDAAPVEEAPWWDRALLPVGRSLTHQVYRNAYHRLLPLDGRRLHYYQAWAALRRLCWYGSWMRAGPRVMGYKPTAVRHVRAAHVADLERYVRRHSGVAVRLGLPLNDPPEGEATAP